MVRLASIVLGCAAVAVRLSTAVISMILATAGISACAKPLESRNADPSRQVAPLPACVRRLPGQQSTGGVRSALKEAEYWSLVFPSFEADRMHLPADALACNGAPVFQDQLFSDSSPRHGEPGEVEEGDILYGGGGAQLKLAWFRTHVASDGSSVGPLAMVRALDGLGEVYAVGVHRSRARTRLSLERMGSDVVAAAADEGCLERAEGQPCESRLTLYLPWRGELRQVAQIALERIGYGVDSEPGMSGRVEYRLVSTLDYKDRGVVVLEQITATDSLGRELRRAELEFLYALEDGTLKSSGESLWPLVAPATEGGGGPTPPEEATAEPGEEPEEE